MMIKKSISVLLVVILCVSSIVSAVAAEKMKMVPIPEKGVVIAAPESYIIFRQGDTELDSRLIPIGLSANDLSSAMAPNNVYLYIFHPEFKCDVNVVVTDSSGISSLAVFDDDLLGSLLDMYREQFEQMGVTVEKNDVRRNGNLAFIRSWGKVQQSNGQGMLQYLTVVDSQSIVFTLANYDGPITDEDEKLLEQIVMSSELSKQSNTSTVSHSIEDDMPNLDYYHDAETGFNFIIPNGWEQRNLSKERQTIKMKMAPIDVDYEASIMFGWNDLWSEIPDSSKSQWGVSSRRDLDSWATADMFAALFDVAEKDVTVQNYGGIDFGLAWVKQDTALGINIDAYCAVTIKNGYAIYFYLYDLNKNNKYIDVFTKVLDSIYLD